MRPGDAPPREARSPPASRAGLAPLALYFRRGEERGPEEVTPLASPACVSASIAGWRSLRLSEGARAASASASPRSPSTACARPRPAAAARRPGRLAPQLSPPARHSPSATGDTGCGVPPPGRQPLAPCGAGPPPQGAAQRRRRHALAGGARPASSVSTGTAFERHCDRSRPVLAPPPAPRSSGRVCRRGSPSESSPSPSTISSGAAPRRASDDAQAQPRRRLRPVPFSALRVCARRRRPPRGGTLAGRRGPEASVCARRGARRGCFRDQRASRGAGRARTGWLCSPRRGDGPPGVSVSEMPQRRAGAGARRRRGRLARRR